MDTLANISCVGRYARITETLHGRLWNVQPFNDSYSPMTDIKTVNVAFAHYTKGKETFIIHVNQALDFSKTMEHSILCPNQAIYNNVAIDDIPIALDHQVLSTHSIMFPDSNIQLPLEQRVPTSYLTVRFPSNAEMNECQELHLTENKGE